jgi:hypothetical protein
MEEKLATSANKVFLPTISVGRLELGLDWGPHARSAAQRIA